MPAQKSKRLFFALTPDQATIGHLTALQRSISLKKGHLTRWQHFHMTLVFLGSVPDDISEKVIAQCSRVRSRPFDVRLSRLGLWPQQQILWFAPGETPLPLLQLVTQLQAELRELGLPVESRPYFPHVTLARRAEPSGPLPEVAPVSWHCGAFCLIQSVMLPDGVRYQIVETWPLNG